LEFYAGGGVVIYIPKGDTNLSPGFLLRHLLRWSYGGQEGYGRTSGV